MNPRMEVALKDQTLIYDEAQDAVHILNSTAQHILNEVRQGATLPDIVASLKANYPFADPGDLSLHVEEAIQKINALQLI